MNIIIQKYKESDLSDMVEIWNEAVREGNTFPQEECLSYDTGRDFFESQTYCKVARDIDSEKIMGLYILHPNNVGRCGHICNASYAVSSNARGLHIGEKLVYISGTEHIPLNPAKMYRHIKNFYEDIYRKESELNQIEWASWTHAEFVRIHPFQDGNGRTSRLIMNYQLMSNGFPAVSISKENRLEYFNVLEEYAVRGDLVPFAEMIADLTEYQLDKYLSMQK